MARYPDTGNTYQGDRNHVAPPVKPYTTVHYTGSLTEFHGRAVVVAAYPDPSSKSSDGYRYTLDACGETLSLVRRQSFTLGFRY